MATPTGPKAPKPSNPYLKYGGLGLQLLATIGLFAWAGYWLDNRLALKFPVFLLLFTFAGLGGSLYQLYRRVMK
jgi:F0F1-type ATP synthase assembly protein I